MSPDIEPAPFRLCLDLNVWCAALLSEARGRSGSATQFLVDVARRGMSEFGPTQVVISWGMIDRLSLVLGRDMGFTHAAVETIAAEIALTAQVGPAELAPLLVLGGAGLVPLRDVEDAHVLEIAFAGRARLLATANFDDFISYRTTVLQRGRIAVYRRFDHEVIIAHPSVAAGWLRTGEMRLG